MTDAEMNLDSFVFDGIWTGQLNAPWLGGPIHSIAEAEESGVADSQRACMRVACTRGDETLDALKQRLFDEYQNEIYGSVVAYSSDGTKIDLTPKIEDREQLWSMLCEVTINIPPDHRIDDDCCFALSFECPWDEEHGLSVLFDSTGAPTDVGGFGDHF